jgi:hypothetical protein
MANALCTVLPTFGPHGEPLVPIMPANRPAGLGVCVTSKSLHACMLLGYAISATQLAAVTA